MMVVLFGNSVVALGTEKSRNGKFSNAESSQCGRVAGVGDFFARRSERPSKVVGTRDEAGPGSARYKSWGD